MKLVGIVYGLICYVLGVASLALFILFANNHMGIFGDESLLALNIDTVNEASSFNPYLINILLLALFGVQHSVMARPGFKAILTKLIPTQLERSTYVLGTSVVIYTLVFYWQPLPGSLWHVENESARLAINLVFYFGWVVSLAATYLINHFHLFGLQQSFGSSEPASKEFVTPFLYKIVRHPIQTGVVIAMIATPDMTTTRLVLAVGMFVYIAVGLRYEERDLIAEFGETYKSYRERVPGVLPIPMRRK